MLVLKLKEGQKVFINGGEIEVCFLHAQDRSAKIGFTAPSSVNILRESICPEGPTRCCHCGGKLPPAGADGERAIVYQGCSGEKDPDNGMCRAFIAEVLCGDAGVGPEREEGGA